MSIRRDKYPFQRCLNPHKLMNPYTKEWIVVPCGHCPACRLQKDLLSTLKCKLESVSHRYCMFVTLTYAPAFLPQSGFFDLTTEDGKVTRHLINVSPRCGGHLDLGIVQTTDSQIDMLQSKVQSEYMPYLWKKDLQLFLKRLRKNLKSNEKIRYYAVGEYGPFHFRPHFHLLLWYDSQSTQQEMGEAISKSWQFGRIDFQLSKGDATSYVAKYLNGACTLPQVLQLDTIKPFVCHSKRLGEEILLRSQEEVYQCSPLEFTERCVSLDGNNTEFRVWRSFKARFFPKCRRFDSLARSERNYAYQTFRYCQRAFSEDKPVNLARLITDALFDYGHKLRRVSPYGDWSATGLLAYYYYITGLSKFGQFQIESGLYNRVYNCVYTDLLLSRHFLYNVCDNWSPEEINRKINLIENYYVTIDYENLKNQLDSMSYFAEICDTDLFKYYYINTFDEETFKKMSLYNCFKKATLHNSLNHVKHKKQNDLNQIFNYM